MKVMRTKNLFNRKKINKDDRYTVKNSLEITDIDGDGVEDIVAKHYVTKNGQVFVESTVRWYGLETEVTEAFVAIAEEEGLLEDYETNKFSQISKEWKKLNRCLNKITKLADKKVKEVE